MGFKRFIRKVARFILANTDSKKIEVNISQISNKEMLKDKNILITGGGSGLGLAMAIKFYNCGATVIISGRNENKLKKAIKTIGPKAKYIKFDVTNFNATTSILERIKKDYNIKINTLICNAGISLHENIFTNVTEETFDKQFNTNFKANYFISKYFLEFCKNENINNGNVLFISSESGSQNYDTPYGLTKSSLNSLVGALSRRVYKDGIRVNAISPGVTASEMTKEYADISDGNVYRKCSSDRVFLAEEVAEVASFLISDAAKCISGEIIHTNAGNHLNPFWEE